MAAIDFLLQEITLTWAGVKPASLGKEATRGLLTTDLVILNHGQWMRTTPEPFGFTIVWKTKTKCDPCLYRTLYEYRKSSHSGNVPFVPFSWKTTSRVHDQEQHRLPPSWFSFLSSHRLDQLID
ncbi:hypothetical protein TNCV_921781 [Trichonephila clavipes]|nr:hypothetical protein TNCV_921781 [Trichonephila clavipes]